MFLIPALHIPVWCSSYAFHMLAQLQVTHNQSHNQKGSLNGEAILIQFGMGVARLFADLVTKLCEQYGSHSGTDCNLPSGPDFENSIGEEIWVEIRKRRRQAECEGGEAAKRRRHCSIALLHGKHFGRIVTAFGQVHNPKYTAQRIQFKACGSKRTIKVYNSKYAIQTLLNFEVQTGQHNDKLVVVGWWSSADDRWGPESAACGRAYQCIIGVTSRKRFGTVPALWCCLAMLGLFSLTIETHPIATGSSDFQRLIKCLSLSHLIFTYSSMFRNSETKFNAFKANAHEIRVRTNNPEAVNLTPF